MLWPSHEFFEVQDGPGRNNCSNLNDFRPQIIRIKETELELFEFEFFHDFLARARSFVEFESIELFPRSRLAFLIQRRDLLRVYIHIHASAKHVLYHCPNQYESKTATCWNLKHLSMYKWLFQWMIPKLSMGNCCLTKHLLKTDCLVCHAL